MDKTKSGPKTIDEYLAACPADVRTKLEELRATIRAAAPGATEKISYQMPAFYLEGNLVYFAAFKDHFSFFPTSSGIQAFQKELSKYEGAKGTVRFPLDEPLPLKLIAKIVKFRVAENLEQARLKSAKKAGKRKK